MERYSAFISYSHADERAARWLHRAIEDYRFPRAVIGHESEFGTVQRKLPPVFRDRDELRASADLGAELRAALAASRFQIVLCSPAAAQSHWVNEEIIQFKQLHGEARTLALILSGEPYAGDERECFPPALRFRVGTDGALTDQPAEPIAADIRKGKDGRRLALQKVLAGISGLKLDDLVRREAARRQQRLTIAFAASTAVSVLTIGLAVYAELQRRVAVEQRELADRSLEFLVRTFEIANPATENPRTITAMTILDRASQRAQSEFRSDPAVSSRLLRTTGLIYSNLGLPEESERDLRAALTLAPESGEERATILLGLAALARQHVDPERAAMLVEQASRAYNHKAAYAPALNAQLAMQRANVAYMRASYAEAGDLYAEAARLYRKLDGEHTENVGDALMKRALSLTQIRDPDRANDLFAEAVRIMSAKFGMADVRTARALQNQALANFDAGRADEAATILERAIAIYGRVLEADHPNLAEANLLLGRIDTARGDSLGAIQAFARARRIYAHLYGAGNAKVGDVDFFTAEAEALAGRYDEALLRAAGVKAIYDSSYGPDDPDQAEVLRLRARILAAAGRPAEATQECRRAIELQRRIGVDAAIRAATRLDCAKLADSTA